MDKKFLKIGIISDIHCHKYGENEKKNKRNQNSYLTCESVRKPEKQHPVAALLKLIKNYSISLDLLIVAGDLCDQIDTAGFLSAWNQVKEIGQHLKVDEKIIATIGNHDVDSRSETGDPFSTAKSLDPLFPVKEESLQNDFFARGFCIIDYEDLDIIIVNINSAHHHFSLPQARKGEIDSSQIEFLEQKLNELSKKRKHKIAVCHHHPIPHESSDSVSTDVMVNGTLLINLLERFQFTLLIHGHKHDVLLRNSNNPGGMKVFGAGSFSCTAINMLPSREMLNTFHVLTLENEEKENLKNQGIIETYFFVPGMGWEKRSIRYFPHSTGFGCELDTPRIAIIIYEHLIKKRNLEQISNFDWFIIQEEISILKYLMPSQFEQLEQECRKKGIQFLYDKTQTITNLKLH